MQVNGIASVDHRSIARVGDFQRIDLQPCRSRAIMLRRCGYAILDRKPYAAASFDRGGCRACLAFQQFVQGGHHALPF